ncbi:MAG: hypothetical protein AAFY29_10205 [Pseudomonadota bacterium]
MKTMFSTCRHASSIALLLALACLPATAQETADRTPPGAVAEDREEAPDGPITPSEAELVVPEAGPLEDYEASEQISEDLSVSFPVDI